MRRGGLQTIYPGDLSLMTDLWTSLVTACVNWWLRHPDETAAQMSRRARRVVAAVTTISVEDRGAHE